MALSKKISQLTALTSASLDTTLLGIDGGVSYKIELDVLADAVKDRINTLDDIRLDSLEAFTSSYTTTSIPNGTISGSSQLTSSFDERYTLSGSVQSIILPTDLISSSAQITSLGFISSSTDLSSINTFTQSIDSRVDSLESWSSSLTTTFATDLEVSIVSSSVAATIGIISQATGLATTGSNTFYGDQQIEGQITASYYLGDGRYLNNLSATTNWNYNQEYTIKKTEQLTFSGDYMLENTYLYIEGGQSASIGEWITETWGTNATYTPNGNNGYTITGPTGDDNASIGVWMHRQFDTNTTMSIQYVWNGEDVGNDWPIYAVDTQYPYEINTENRLQDINATTESGTWTINVPSGSWLSIGVNTANRNATSGSLQITLPYILNEDISQYSPNKYFKKEGSIFIGGNLLVKDSTIVNNGKISVGGEVILIGNSEITGTGTII